MKKKSVEVGNDLGISEGIRRQESCALLPLLHMVGHFIQEYPCCLKAFGEEPKYFKASDGVSGDSISPNLPLATKE